MPKEPKKEDFKEADRHRSGRAKSLRTLVRKHSTKRIADLLVGKNLQDHVASWFGGSARAQFFS
jgi:hypothetical protein